MADQAQGAKPLFGRKLKAINVGLEGFAESMKVQGVDTTHVDWRPPAAGWVPLTTTRDGVDIDAANAEAYRRITAGRPSSAWAWLEMSSQTCTSGSSSTPALPSSGSECVDRCAAQ